MRIINCGHLVISRQDKVTLSSNYVQDFHSGFYFLLKSYGLLLLISLCVCSWLCVFVFAQILMSAAQEVTIVTVMLAALTLLAHLRVPVTLVTLDPAQPALVSLVAIRHLYDVAIKKNVINER